jgi:thiamine-phosphate pyrophosphorylase
MDVIQTDFGFDHSGAIDSVMRRRHPLPKIWLMTDPRMPDVLASIARLPKGSGIIFRHYEWAEGRRRALFKQVRGLARRGRHILILADTPLRARQWGADGAHDRSAQVSQGLRTVAVHSVREATLAKRVGADLMFVSPVFPTQSHPNGRMLGRIGLGQLTAGQRHKTIALGGMTTKRAKSLRSLKIHGWAAIDAFRT